MVAKSKFVFFEGTDRVGKDTTIAEFNKVTNFTHVTINRGPASFDAYDLLLRGVKRNRGLMYDPSNSVIVFLTCGASELERRAKATKEPSLPVSLTDIQNLIGDNIALAVNSARSRGLKLPVIIAETDVLTQKQIALSIASILIKMDK